MYNCDPLKEKERQYFPEGECVCVCNLVWSDRINAYMYMQGTNVSVTTYMHTYIHMYTVCSYRKDISLVNSLKVIVTKFSCFHARVFYIPIHIHTLCM